MEEYKKPKPKGVAFGVTIDDSGKYQLVRFKLNGKSAHSFEVVKDDLTRYDIKAQFEAQTRRFFHDFEETKLH